MPTEVDRTNPMPPRTSAWVRHGVALAVALPLLALGACSKKDDATATPPDTSGAAAPAATPATPTPDTSASSGSMAASVPDASMAASAPDAVASDPAAAMPSASSASTP